MKAFGAELVLTPKSGGMEYARDLAEKRLREIVTNVGAALGVSAEINYSRGYPATINSAATPPAQAYHRRPPWGVGRLGNGPASTPRIPCR